MYDHHKTNAIIVLKLENILNGTTFADAPPDALIFSECIGVFGVFLRQLFAGNLFVLSLL